MYELRRELRNLREWDRQQERESREAHIAKEAELKNGKIKKKYIYIFCILRKHIKSS